VAIFLLPQESFSEQENRTLQTMPALTLDTLTDNGLSRDVADFYADQFPARSTLIDLKTLSEISLLRMENNGVLIGKNGYLIKYGSAYNMPTQRSMDMGLMRIKETAVTHSDGHVTVNKTVKITGKGQEFFINLFL
jgi:phage antirepressor YoqD-like protein